MSRNTLKLTEAQSTVQDIDKSVDRLVANATPILNRLTGFLSDSEDPQAIFDVWDTDALTELTNVKTIAVGLVALGADVTPLRADFALPEIVDGAPTGRLIFNPAPELEEENLDIPDDV